MSNLALLFLQVPSRPLATEAYRHYRELYATALRSYSQSCDCIRQRLRDPSDREDAYEELRRMRDRELEFALRNYLHEELVARQHYVAPSLPDKRDHHCARLGLLGAI